MGIRGVSRSSLMKGNLNLFPNKINQRQLMNESNTFECAMKCIDAQYIRISEYTSNASSSFNRHFILRKKKQIENKIEDSGFF